MAVFNGKEGRWVTTKEGKHRFIEGAEDPIDKRDRDIKERESQTKKLTADKNGDFSAKTKQVYGMSEDSPEDLQKKYNSLYMLVSEMSKAGYERGNKDFDNALKTEAKVKKQLFDIMQGRGDDKPEGKPIETHPKRYDGHTGISRSFDKYKNGYFVREVKFARDDDGKYNVVSDTTRRISKEDFEHANGADHKKMAENDFSDQIKSVRAMPEKTLKDVKAKEQAYEDLVNAMKKGGYQGSENRDYNDVIKEYVSTFVKRGDMEDATKTKKAAKASKTIKAGDTAFKFDTKQWKGNLSANDMMIKYLKAHNIPFKFTKYFQLIADINGDGKYMWLDHIGKGEVVAKKEYLE